MVNASKQHHPSFFRWSVRLSQHDIFDAVTGVNTPRWDPYMSTWCTSHYITLKQTTEKEMMSTSLQLDIQGPSSVIFSPAQLSFPIHFPQCPLMFGSQDSGSGLS
eukprot:PhF_6_TR2534/c0_g1_i2/m.4304